MLKFEGLDRLRELNKKLIYSEDIGNRCYISTINVRAAQKIGSITQLVEHRCAYVMIRAVRLGITSSSLVAAQYLFEGVSERSRCSALRLRE